MVTVTLFISLIENDFKLYTEIKFKSRPLSNSELKWKIETSNSENQYQIIWATTSVGEQKIWEARYNSETKKCVVKHA